MPGFMPGIQGNGRMRIWLLDARDKLGHDNAEMIIRLTAEVTGAAEIVARLDDIAAAAKDALDEALSEGAGTLRAQAALAAPKRTGRLSDSIAVERHGLFDLAVAAKAPYARFVELGTRQAPARPFLSPALFRLRRALIARAGEILARALRRR